MKICHIINSLGNGGAEKNLVRLSLNQIKNNKVIIITLKKKNFFYKILKKKKIKIFSLDLKFNFQIFKKIFYLLNIIKKEKPNIIFSWMFHSALISSFIAKIYNIKLFWCIRHGNFILFKSKILTIIIAKFILPILSSIPFKIVYNSNFSRKYYEDLGYRKKKSRVIYNGYSKEYFKPNKFLKKKFIKKYKIKNNHIILGYVARFSPQKNHIFLLDCLSFIKKKYDINFKLVLVGNNVQNNQSLLNLINKFDLKKETIILKETNKINLVYPIFDINVLVSSYGESFPNTLAESMLCGIPCISSQVGDSKYIIGKTGFTFKQNDKKSFIKYLIIFKKKFFKTNKINYLTNNCRSRILTLFNLSDKIKKYNKLYSVL